MSALSQLNRCALAFMRNAAPQTVAVCVFRRHGVALATAATKSRRVGAGKQQQAAFNCTSFAIKFRLSHLPFSFFHF